MTVLTDKEFEIPNDLFNDSRITKHYEISTYVALRLFAENGIDNPSMAEIAELARCNAKTASKAIKTLEECGWVKRTLKPLTNPVYEVYDEVEELPEIEVGKLTLANRQNNDLTSPRRSFGRNVR